MLQGGLTKKQIASKLGIETSTIKNLFKTYCSQKAMKRMEKRIQNIK